MITFADWLSSEIKRKPELNQTALAIHIGLSQSTISSWLRGLYVPQPENCRKIARFFNIPDDDVLVVAGHRHPVVIGADNSGHLAEPPTPYHIGPRARLDALLDHLTDDQLEALITFLETLQ